jgi:hypothetical protein
VRAALFQGKEKNMINVMLAMFIWFPKEHKAIRLAETFTEKEACSEAFLDDGEVWIIGTTFSAFADEKPKIKGKDGLDMVGEVYRKKFDCATVKNEL